MDRIQWWWGPLEAIVDFGGWIVVLGALALWGWIFPAENTPATKNIRELTKEENAEWKKQRDQLRDIERGRFFGEGRCPPPFARLHSRSGPCPHWAGPVTMTRMPLAPYLGVDLAWSGVNETGLVALQRDGRISDAEWRSSTEDVARWIEERSAEDAYVFIDAPLVIENPNGMRECEKEVGRRYGRWKVSANASNTSSPGQEGVALRALLEDRGFQYDDGTAGNVDGGRRIFECYPYTTIVGVRALGYDHERPRYKRKPAKMPAASWSELRASETDELIRRVGDFVTEDPPMDLTSHPETRRLVDMPTPQSNIEAKHREDLLDAALCAWTAALWDRFGSERCQVLGENDPPVNGRRATIIAPARESQRRR